jgi:hypothetical protein
MTILIPVLVLAQPEAMQSQNRIRLGPDPRNTDSGNWSEWRSAEAEEFTWTPPRAFWRGFVKTSKTGQKTGIFVGIFTPQVDLDPETFNQSAASGFADDGAVMTGEMQMEVSGYAADNLVFSSSGGNGLYFAGGRTPTTVSVVHVKLEKEKNASFYPFLVFYMATPSAAFGEVEAEFEEFVEATYIQPVYGSISGRVTSRFSGAGIESVEVTLLGAKPNQMSAKTTTADGGWRFDSLTASSYYLTVAAGSEFNAAAQPKTIELASGQDLGGIGFELEPVAAPVVVKTQPGPQSETFVAIGFGLGVGYRHRLDNNWGLGVNARIGSFVPEATIGFDLMNHGGQSENRVLASLGVHCFFWNSARTHAGLGLVAGGDWLNDKPTWSLQLPLTAEHFVSDRLSVQASVGPFMTFAGDSIHFALGPMRLTGSLGFTWYVK